MELDIRIIFERLLNGDELIKTNDTSYLNNKYNVRTSIPYFYAYALSNIKFVKIVKTDFSKNYYGEDYFNVFPSTKSKINRLNELKNIVKNTTFEKDFNYTIQKIERKLKLNKIKNCE